MNRFLSCDWGTSALRLRLIDTDNFEIIVEVITNEGIAATFSLWQKSDHPKKEFYLNIIKKHIIHIENETGSSLNDVQVIISGMASSTIGFIDIPYSPLPVSVDGTGIKTIVIPAYAYFNHNTLVISGIKSDDDVARGEETQLIGCIDLLPGKIEDELFILPGTHSKHIHVLDNQIVAIKTYMTGEFFELLSQKSILTTTVEKHSEVAGTASLIAFKKGVNDAVDSNLLNQAFSVRTNQIFNKLTKAENFSYLSGLLIGTELTDITRVNVKNINLFCNAALSELYFYALAELGLSEKTTKITAELVDKALIHGQYKIYKQSLL